MKTQPPLSMGSSRVEGALTFLACHEGVAEWKGYGGTVALTTVGMGYGGRAMQG